MKSESISRRLDQVKHLVSGASSAPAPAAPARYRKLAEAVGGELMVGPAGCFCRVTTTYPVGYPFGDRVLGDIDRAQMVSASSFSATECNGQTRVGDLLFLDTETTGLGGTGAVPFLIGCGSITLTGFEVRQYLLPDYSDEAAMLEQVLTEFAEDGTLVSYNGSAFDLNIIRDRLIVNRVSREIPHSYHFDLLHSARRLYRRRLSDCTLTNIEREVFGFHRAADIPGYLIPSVYFDWLQNDNLDPMASVLEHNQLDILALCFLLLRIDEVFGTDGATLDYADDLYSLSRVYGRRKRHEKAVANFPAVEEQPGKPAAADALFFYSMAFKRTGAWPQAVRLWKQLTGSPGREAFLACLELAKYYEHRVKDNGQAARYARMALKSGAGGTCQRTLLDRRLERLRRKLSL